MEETPVAFVAPKGKKNEAEVKPVVFAFAADESRVFHAKGEMPLRFGRLLSKLGVNFRSDNERAVAYLAYLDEFFESVLPNSEFAAFTEMLDGQDEDGDELITGEELVAVMNHLIEAYTDHPTKRASGSRSGPRIKDASFVDDLSSPDTAEAATS